MRWRSPGCDWRRGGRPQLERVPPNHQYTDLKRAAVRPDCEEHQRGDPDRPLRFLHERFRIRLPQRAPGSESSARRRSARTCRRRSGSTVEPMTLPSTAGTRIRARPPSPSRRVWRTCAPLSVPVRMPTRLVPLATVPGPREPRAGTVISEPSPASVLMIDATVPTPRSRSESTRSMPGDTTGLRRHRHLR